MSAETLWRAAALMRERASDAYSAVDDGDWRFDNIGWNESRGTTYVVENDTMPVCFAELEEAAVHIASWHPGMAFAVANWLDAVAASAEKVHEADAEEMFWGTEALAVARAYLGESSDG